jgi:hypothetical protein
LLHYPAKLYFYGTIGYGKLIIPDVDLETGIWLIKNNPPATIVRRIKGIK